MSKILSAECESESVKSEGFEIPDAEILSIGKGQSNGILIIEGNRKYYLPSSAQDLFSTLEKISTALEKISTALNTLDTAGYIIAVSGGSGSPAVGTPATPFIAGEVSELESLKSDLDELKDNLR